MVSLIRLFGSYARDWIIGGRHFPLIPVRTRRVHHIAESARVFANRERYTGRPHARLESPPPAEPGEQGDDDADGLIMPPPPWWRS